MSDVDTVNENSSVNDENSQVSPQLPPFVRHRSETSEQCGRNIAARLDCDVRG